MARFKAREFKRIDFDNVSDASSAMHLSAAKRTPKAITQPKEVRLHSLARSQSRDEFNRKMREKELE